MPGEEGLVAVTDQAGEESSCAFGAQPFSGVWAAAALDLLGDSELWAFGTGCLRRVMAPGDLRRI